MDEFGDLTLGIVALFATILGVVLTIRSRRAGHRILVALREDGYVSADPERDLGLTFENQPVQQISAMSVAYMNAGNARVDRGSTEEPVIIRLTAENASESLKIVSVEGEGISKACEESFELKVEQLHPSTRRNARILQPGPPRPHASISGALSGESGPPSLIRNSAASPRLQSLAVALPALVLWLVIFVWAIPDSEVVMRSSLSPTDEEALSVLLDANLDDFDEPVVRVTDQAVASSRLPLLALAGLFLTLVFSDNILAVLRRSAEWLQLTSPHPFEVREEGDYGVNSGYRESSRSALRDKVQHAVRKYLGTSDL